MEKQQSRSAGSTFPVVGSTVHSPAYRPPTAAPEASAANPAPGPAKPSRDDVTRCIRIWASVYRLVDEDCAAELQMPPRTWSGRITARLDRFN